jgi:SAM-dependent methyltransferase
MTAVASSIVKEKSWPQFLDGVSLFQSAVRLRFLIWTLQRYFPTGSTFIEVGCGSGTTAVLLADLGYRVLACDIEAELISRVQGKYSDWLRSGRFQVQQEDMFNLPWRQTTFDAAYHQGVLEHFEDDQIVRALKEQARVARFVVFDVPNHRYPDQVFGDERLLPPRHWHRLIAEAGLEVIEERGRDFSHWLYLLPFAFFSHEGLEKMTWFSRWFAVSSIFVCKSLAAQ